MRSFCFLALAVLLHLAAVAQPKIDSIVPISAEAGSVVTIYGKSLGKTNTPYRIYFGGSPVRPYYVTDSVLKAVVPASATYGPVAVIYNGFTVSSPNAFIPTFKGNRGPLTANSFLPKVEQEIGMYPHAVLLADLNTDGKNELIVSRGSSYDLTILPNTSNGQGIQFGTPISLAGNGDSQDGIAIADIDGDSLQDIIQVNSLINPSFSVYRNKSGYGTPSFYPRVDFPTDIGGYEVGVGDLDGDHKPDIVIPCGGTNFISVYKNTSIPGTVSFAAPVKYSFSGYPYGVAIADFDGDGQQDIAISMQSGTESLVVLRNLGTGGNFDFQEQTIVATLPGAFTVRAGDLNKDGKPDLLGVSSSSKAIKILENQSIPGTINFPSEQLALTANYPVDVTIADINGDSLPDLVSANRFGNSVTVFRNTLSGSTISFDQGINYATAEAPIYVCAGDLNGDHRPELISANSSATSVSILQNSIGLDIAPSITSFNPDTAVANATIHIQGRNFTGVTKVSFGGVDASSFKVDSATGITAVVGAGKSGAVSVSSPNGTGSRNGFVYISPLISSFTPTNGQAGTVINIYGENFTNVTGVSFGGTPAASYIVQNANYITAVVGAGSSGSVMVSSTNGNGSLPRFSYGAPSILAVNPASGEVGSTVTISGNNFPLDPQQLVVYFGAVRANILSTSAGAITVQVPAGATYQPITVTSNQLTAYSSAPFNVIFPKDSLQINAQLFTTADFFGTDTYPGAVAVADLNIDGKPDLIAANRQSNTITLLRNISDAAGVKFAAKQSFTTGKDPIRIATGDLDGDGLQDIVVTNFNAGGASTISIFRNQSSGAQLALAAGMQLSSGNGSIGLGIRDMNADGKPDIVVTSGNSGFVSVFQNSSTGSGNISFLPKIDYSNALSHSDDVTLADLDKDGLPEMIVSNFSEQTFTIYANSSSGGQLNLLVANNFPTGMSPTYSASGDLNGDGLLDILVNNYSSKTIGVYKNFSTPGSFGFTNQSLPAQATNLALSDVNGDGLPDLITGIQTNGSIQVMQNQSNNSAIQFAAITAFPMATGDCFVAAADLTGDGRPELISANTLQNNIAVLTNRGNLLNQPEITNLSADSAVAGSTVVINGNQLSGINAVSFGGVPAASFQVVSSKRIDAVVVEGASGDIKISGTNGQATIKGFKYIPAISADGPLEFCTGAVTLSSTAAANNQWYKNGSVLNGATGRTLKVEASGTCTVATTSNGITTFAGPGLKITAIGTTKPKISTANLHDLQSDALTGNQWFLNGQPITGATSQTLSITESGTYTVQVTVNGCTSVASDPYVYVATGVINLGNDQYIRIYPNPVSTAVRLNWKINGSPKMNIQITDLQGHLMKQVSGLRQGDQILMATLPKGVYFIRIYDDRLKINRVQTIIKGE